MKAKFALLIASLAMAALPVAAHHSFAAFDTSAEKTISGTVKQFDWTNPHTWIWVDVANQKGGVDTYGFEGMSPNYLARRGWTKTTVKPGDAIAIPPGQRHKLWNTGTDTLTLLCCCAPAYEHDDTVITGEQSA